MQSLARRLTTTKRSAAGPNTHLRRRRESLVGNQAVLRRLQAKLTVGAVNDPLEHEADAVAEQVMRMPDPAVGVTRSPLRLSRKCDACEEDDKKLRTKRDDSVADNAEAPALVHDVLGTPGSELNPGLRAFFEPRFGTDLSGVRVHQDQAAQRSAQAVGARAYTVGADIVFGAGSFAPQSGDGRRLIAHELAHVVQQNGDASALRRQSGPKTGGGPLDLKPDPCVTLPGLGTLCGQAAREVCEKNPGIPGCGLVCKIFGCTKKQQPTTACPPGTRAATSSDYAGQCCIGTGESATNCCSPDRMATLPVPHCCTGDEAVDPQTKNCIKSSDIPVSPICNPWEKTTTGKCCIPPMVPKGADCVFSSCDPAQQTLFGECCIPPMVPRGAICFFPDSPAPPPKNTPSPATLVIHFQQDHPGPRESDPATILTPTGRAEIAAAQAMVAKTPDALVRLIGSASSEGATDYNLALSTRRVQFVAGKLGGKTGDPPVSDGADAGCTGIGKGMWSCGETKADQSRADPEDRVVRVTLIPGANASTKAPP